MTPRDGLSIAIDTSSDVAGVCLAEAGQLLAEVTWRTRQNHSREVLPAIDWLLARQGRDKHDLVAVFVCTGPGSYAGLRVGISTAKAMAYGLGIPVLGAGRLEADALPLAGLSASRLVPLHAAGRAELAWAAYVAAMPGLREVVAPGLAPAAALLNAIEPKDVVVADLATLPADLPGQLSERGARLVQAATNRAVAVSALGWQRVQAGVGDEQATLVPLYLRAPAIGPQNQPSR